jgi:magnesium-transporting ATPase (P-type)
MCVCDVMCLRVQIYFSFVNGFSAQNLFNDFLIVVFNIFLTSLAPFANACFEKDLPEIGWFPFPACVSVPLCCLGLL